MPAAKKEYDDPFASTTGDKPPDTDKPPNVDKPEVKQDADTTGDDSEKEPDWYCPGCGRRYSYQRECTGTPEAPHQPIEVVPVSELDGDPESHTKAPDTV